MLKIEKFVRKSFDVDGVRVTEENMDEVARWCGGDVRTNKEKKRYIKVRVVRPLNPRQSEAYVNDVVLYAGTGYKVYTPKAFEDSFELSSSPDSLYPGDDEMIAEVPIVDEDEVEIQGSAEPLQPYTGDVMNPFGAPQTEQPFEDPRKVV